MVVHKFKEITVLSSSIYLEFEFSLFSSVADLSMAIQGVFYRTVARRFSTLLLASATGAYFLDLTVNKATNAYWDSVSCLSSVLVIFCDLQINKGKQWKDIKDKVTQQ